MTKTRTTKQIVNTLYRNCECGETRHDVETDEIEGALHTVYKCRNCRSIIVGPSHESVQVAHDAIEADLEAFMARIEKEKQDGNGETLSARWTLYDDH